MAPVLAMRGRNMDAAAAPTLSGPSDQPCVAAWKKLVASSEL